MKAQSRCLLLGGKIDRHPARSLHDPKLLREWFSRIKCLDARQIKREGDCNTLLLQPGNRLIKLQEVGAGGRLTATLLEHLEVMLGVLNPQDLAACAGADLPANALQVREKEQGRFGQFTEPSFHLRKSDLLRLLGIVEGKFKASFVAEVEF